MNSFIGKRLQELRKQKRMTAAQVADRIGISRPYLTQLEGSTRRLSVNNLIKIAEVLGVSVPEVFQENESSQGAVPLFRHIRAINTPAVREKMQPILGSRTDQFLNCAELWMKTPKSVRKALETFEEYLRRQMA